MKAHDDEKVHIGEIIKKVMESKGIQASDLAVPLSTSASNVYSIFKRESVEVEKLCILSALLKFNLFQVYLNREPLKGLFGGEVEQLNSEILQLKKSLAEKDEIIADKKNIITFLEEKVKKLEHPQNTPTGKAKTPKRK